MEGSVMKFVAKGARIGAAAFLCTGCFTYRASELPSVAEGAEVRVQLTRQGFAALPDIPTQSGLRLSGKLVARSDDQLRMRVPVAMEGRTTTVAQELVIPVLDIARFETRTLSRARTGLAVAGGVGIAIAFYLGFEKGNPFSGGKPDDPEIEGPGFTTGGRILRFSIPLR
jgi:hypothetical protein